jgi:hypothetical protein
MDGRSLKLVHEPLFDDEYDKYDGVDPFDDPLRGLIWGVSENPMVFDVLPDHLYRGLELRIAKTDAIERQDGTVIPRMVLYFALDEAACEILLIYLEPQES